MKIKRIGHVALRVVDQERSKAFYTNVLGFRVSEEDPEHGGVFMTLGDNFHTLDVFLHPDAGSAQQPDPMQVGLAHVAFELASYDELRNAYATLIEHGVTIDRAVDHVSQRSIYFADPDGNRLEIYYEMPRALEVFAEEERGDQDVLLQITKKGEPLPSWLHEVWPAPAGA